MTNDHAVEARGLVKHFKTTKAVDGVDLVVPTGTVLGLLGPNGAGKTTTVRMLATLLRPDAGTARVMGHDVVAEADAVRRIVGLTGQFASVDEDLTGEENLRLIARLYGFSGAQARSRTAELLEAFELAEAGGRQVKTYSGGMRRRIDLAASMVISPSVLFLDEPTTGLDVESRRDFWRQVRSFIGDGRTVVLTTHYLEEADALADRIVLLDEGRLIAEGTPAEIKARTAGKVVRAVTSLDPARLAALPGVNRVELVGAATELLTTDAEETVRELLAADRGLTGLEVTGASLEEAFLAITGGRHEAAAAYTEGVPA